MVELYAYEAGDGDCLRLRFKGSSGNINNIIIDSGSLKFGKKFVELCKNITAANEKVDLLVITHSDDDHLGGLLYSVRHKMVLPFQTVLMNCLNGDNTLNVQLSVRQSNEIGRVIINAGLNLQTALAKTIYNLDGAKIHILSPTRQQCDKLYTRNSENIKLGRRNDYAYDFEVLKAKPIAYKASSLSNASSIVFIFEYSGEKLLFTGDAPAEHIIEGLQEYNGSNSPITFDAVKLPHHGSVGNISDSWSRYINSENYVICTDGKHFPDKQTIAKLLRQHYNLTIFSTSDWWKNNFLTQSDIKNYIDTNKLNFIKINGKVLEW